MPNDPPQHPEGLKSPVTIGAWRYWHSLLGSRIMPARRDIDPADITPLLPHVMLLDVLSEPIDFHYRLIGTYVDERLRQRYTGRTAREFEDKAPGSRLWERLCQVVYTRRPVVSLLPYSGPDSHFKDAEEVMLPLSDDGERVTGIFDALVFVEKSVRRHPQSA